MKIKSLLTKNPVSVILPYKSITKIINVGLLTIVFDIKIRYEVLWGGGEEAETSPRSSFAISSFSLFEFNDPCLGPPQGGGQAAPVPTIYFISLLYVSYHVPS